VRDDGAGFDPAAPSNGGRGLANQLRRAEAIGATIAWAPSELGACLILVLPVVKPMGDPRQAAATLGTTRPPPRTATGASMFD
jgi:hypothetical protein